MGTNGGRFKLFYFYLYFFWIHDNALMLLYARQNNSVFRRRTLYIRSETIGSFPLRYYSSNVGPMCSDVSVECYTERSTYRHQRIGNNTVNCSFYSH